MKRHLVAAACAAMLATGSVLSIVADAQIERTPGGRADKTATSVTGELLRIEGQNYIVRDTFDKEVRLRVSSETKMLGAPPKVGDRIEAKVSEGGQATTLQVTSGTGSRPQEGEKGSKSDKDSGSGGKP